MGCLDDWREACRYTHLVKKEEERSFGGECMYP